MRAVSFLAGFVVSASLLRAEDWPMWRHDPGRTAATATELPSTLRLLWSRELPPLKPAFRDGRLQFDRGYEPVVLGKRLFAGSSFDDSVTALDAETGETLWKFRTGGPVRFAPVATEDRLLFGSDDGHLYCVRASNGELVWKFRAVPSHRTLIGNGRLISVWPVRGGPVLCGNRVYFAAGVCPLEGVFVYCLEVASGAVVWRNDKASFQYGAHPHQAEAFGGLAPQGYLLIAGDDLVVPSSSAYPARFDLQSGELKEFALPSAGRFPGGWFTATLPQKDQRRGLVYDAGVNSTRHEDKPRSEGLPDVRGTITVGSRAFRFADGFPGVTGEIHGMLAADRKLFAVTLDGKLYAFGEGAAQPRRHALPKEAKPVEQETVRRLVAAAGAPRGYAAVFGPVPEGFLEALVSSTALQVVALDLDPALVKGADIPAARLSFVRDVELPPYFASLVVTGTEWSESELRKRYECLRPFGGVLAGPPGLEQVARSAGLPGAAISTGAGFALIRRAGPLEGSTNYTGSWAQSADERVRAPLGVLWFGDEVTHFKRSPQPWFVDGVMISWDKDWLDASTRKGKVDYRLKRVQFSDVYTGRPFDPDEVPELRKSFSAMDQETIQPSQYRPPRQKDDWNPEPPVPGTRLNPLTGEEEPRTIPKSYGCDGGFDYGHLYTVRSATAAFYDKRVESGTVNVSGPRSGCTNSVIPANGLLNLPYFYEGCSCSYPLPMGLALVSRPETFEQWAAWGHVPAASLMGKIRRIGLNFGAPGDRKTSDGTLWLAHPRSRAPSPEIQVTTDPANPEAFYQHSLWLEKPGDTWPWVAASGVRGLRALKLEGIRPGAYTLRLIFSMPESGPPAPFPLRLNGEGQGRSIDLVAEAQAGLRAATRVFPSVAVRGDLSIDFGREVGLCGLELLPAEAE